MLSGAQTLQWSATQGPYSTAVNSFDTSSGAIFAGTTIGLYKSTNGGGLWLPVPAVRNLTSDITAKNGKLYVGGAGGFMLSTDAGATWAVRDSGFPLFAFVYSLKSANGVLYACLGGDGLYRTKDEGKYWEHINSGGIENKTISSLIITANSFIAAEGAGVLRSTDNGFSWTESSGDIANQAVHVFAVKDNKIFAGTDAGIFISIDSGATWNSSGTGMHSDDMISTILVSGDDKTIFAGATNTNSGVGIYRSNDGGASWQLVNNGLPDLSINSLFTTGTQVYAGTSLGISSTYNNGDSWITSSTGLPKPAIASLTSFNGRVFSGSKGSYVFFTDDKGDHWEISKKGLTRPNVNTLLVAGSTLLAGTDAAPKEGKGGIHRSTDNGNTWAQVNDGIPITPITSLTNIGTKIYAGGDRGVVILTDDGKSWSQMNAGLSDTMVKALTDFRSDLFAGTQSGVFEALGNWSIKNTGLSNAHIHAFTSTSSYLYAATDSGVYRHAADSDGFLWRRVSSDSLFIQSLWSNDYILAAGTKTGIYLSSDNGNSWQFQQSAGAVSVNTFCAANRNLYAGTNSGVIAAPLAQFGVQSSTQENSISLQVTNPSTQSATIRYTLKERSDISMIAYDLLGKQYSLITNEKREAAEYTFQWNTSALASGIYIIHLKAGATQRSAMVNVVH